MKKEAVYSKYPIGQRLLFFIAGFLDPLIGYALYYCFKDEEKLEWKLEFIQRGSLFGIIFYVLGIVGYILSILEVF